MTSVSWIFRSSIRIRHANRAAECGSRAGSGKVPSPRVSTQTTLSPRRARVTITVVISGVSSGDRTTTIVPAPVRSRS